MHSAKSGGTLGPSRQSVAELNTGVLIADTNGFFNERLGGPPSTTPHLNAITVAGIMSDDSH